MKWHLVEQNIWTEASQPMELSVMDTKAVKNHMARKTVPSGSLES